MTIWRLHLLLMLLLLLLVTLLLMLPVGLAASPTGGPDVEPLPASAPTTMSAAAKRIKYSEGGKDSFLIHPGTRWCGVGTLATNYTTLGNAYEADKCCRDHDHCDRVIHAKETKYHLTSIFHFTISHCECDVQFYYCLKDAQDSQGSSVIDWFFGLVKVPCFELVERQQICLATRRVSMFSDATECVRNGTGQVAELRQLPFFTDELERMRREQGEIAYS